MRRTKEEYEQAFWARVDKYGPNGCWIWMGAKARPPGNYGHVGKQGAPGVTRTNRVAYELANGPVPGQLHVLHRCDNPPCCNPAHLFLGTPRDNAIDRNAKNRLNYATREDANFPFKKQPPKGSLNHKAKIGARTVRRIRRLYASGRFSQADIAALIGVGQTQISRIVRRVQWSHI